MDKFWIGTVEKCDWCSAPFSFETGTKMYDAGSLAGPWGNFCAKCFEAQTHRKLGMGFGQEYTRQDDTRWKKTGG